MHDIIVVGGRCAGASSALLLARAGYRVLLLERAPTMRDTLSTLYIHQPGVALLNRWGVLDDVVASGCPPIESIAFATPEITLCGSSWPADTIAAAYAPRRAILDDILWQAAGEAGAELRFGARVEDVVVEAGRVCGVVVDGTIERAALVVGADGMRSTIADRVGAEMVVSDPRMTCAYYAFWSGMPARFRLYESPGAWIGTIPTNNETTLVAAYFPMSQAQTVRRAPLSSLLQAVATHAPEVRAEMDAGEQLERVRGTVDQRNFFRTASGPGWVLVGDAGLHKDSITARGITDAFRQAQLLVDLLDESQRSADDIDSATAVFGEARAELFMADYRNTVRVASLDPPAHQAALLTAISGNTAHTNRYFSAMSGVCPLDEFVTPPILDLLAAASDERSRL